MVKCASGPEVGHFQQRACHDIFLVLGWLVVHAKWLLQVRVSHVWVCFSTCYLVKENKGREEEEKKGSEKGKAGFESGATRFTTDGYCLEFQGHDLMLRSPSISQTL